MKVLVTGGRRISWVGDRAGCWRLAVTGDQPVAALPSDCLSESVSAISGATSSMPERIAAAAVGCDAVIHTAAKAGVWGSYRSFYEPNVTGTANVIGACRSTGVGRLVMTSSPSVVFHGSDMEGVDESVPYPDVYHAPYPETKAIAERMVLDCERAGAGDGGTSAAPDLGARRPAPGEANRRAGQERKVEADRQGSQAD